MRFSIAIAPKQPQDAAAEREHAQGWASDDAPLPYKLPPSSAPWPPGEPPDDLDQRVRQVGEW
jgi:hypothetical protein